MTVTTHEKNTDVFPVVACLAYKHADVLVGQERVKNP